MVLGTIVRFFEILGIAFAIAMVVFVSFDTIIEIKVDRSKKISEVSRHERRNQSTVQPIS